MDTITDILARPDEAARQLSEMRAALEASAACVPAARAALEEIKVKFAAVIAERDVARVDLIHVSEQWHDAEKRAEAAQTAKTRVIIDYSAALIDARQERDNALGRASQTEYERDAARAEVARLTAALSECRAALYGAREITGNIGNIGHAIDLADVALAADPAPAGREARP